MALTHFVQKRMVGPKGAYELKCRTCGKPIEIGQPYKWFKRKAQRGGVKMSYHPDCRIRPSHRTTSRMGEIYDAQEDLNFSGVESVDDAQSILSDFAQVVRDVGYGYEESAQNIEDGFGHEVYQSQELREKAEALEEWANDLEDVDFSSAEEPEDEADYESEDDFEAAKDEYYDQIREIAESAANECPV